MTTVYPGQIFNGYISLMPGCDGPIKFSFKGMWPAFRAKYLADIAKAATEEEQEAIILQTMALIITQWNLKYPDNHPDEAKRCKPVPINADVIKADVMVHVRNRIMAIATWQAFSDVDPSLEIEKQAKQIADRSKVKSIAEMMAEADKALVGNS